MRIEKSRDLYNAVKTLDPEVEWDERRWRAYKATHSCPTSQRLWLHYAIIDLNRQTKGKLTFKDIMALVGASELEAANYKVPPQLIDSDEDLEELRVALIYNGYTDPRMHLLVYQIYLKGLKGDAAADAAKVSRPTFRRYLNEVLDIKNNRYKDEGNAPPSKLLLGRMALVLDGELYDEDLHEVAIQARKGILHQDVINKIGPFWLYDYFLWLQDNSKADEHRERIFNYLDKVIKGQEKAKERLK